MPLHLLKLVLAPSPAHEVILGPLVLVPDGDLELAALVLEEREVELFQPPRIQSLVDRLRLVALVAESGIMKFNFFSLNLVLEGQK